MTLSPTIAVDTSALAALLFREPLFKTIRQVLVDTERPRMSIASYVELSTVAIRRIGEHGWQRADLLIATYKIDLVPFTLDHAKRAADGYQRYGKGSGHPAKLNLGDAYTYGFAKAENLPLLFVGDDFVHTDLEPALTTRD